MKFLIRALFYRAPNVEDVYAFDDEEADNPFSNSNATLVKVMDVKDGWVRYHHIKSPRRVECRSVRLFNAMFKLHKRG